MASNQNQISTRMAAIVKALEPITSATGEVHKAHPNDIKFGDGENKLMQSKMIDVCKDAMAKSISMKTFANPNGFEGDETLKQAFASYFNTYFNPSIPVESEHIVPTAGSGNALESLLCTICDAGDSVLCPAPAWRAYGFFGMFHAGISIIPAYVETTSQSWWVDSMSLSVIAALEKAYTSAPDSHKIKAVLISNPSNPFARCWPEDVLREMAKFCNKYGLHFISDEVFANTAFHPQDEKFTSMLSVLHSQEAIADEDFSTTTESQDTIDSSRVHIVWSMSKDFGACGVRSGCAMTYNPLVRSGVSYASFWQISSLTAHFTTAVLTSPLTPSWVSDTKTQLRNLHNLCRDILVVPELSGRLEILPANAGFWVNAIVTLREGETTKDIVVRARTNHILIDVGNDFGRFLGERQGEFKITFSKEEGVLRAGLERLKESLV
ncbi:hypothetical protein N7478_008363 [Penicillium angulare]|uniref:uncharacterized protein n=1 Tax=Penicillium angulare TaxID=116970 RepID=UPI002540CBE7|nr:uncharacterized protein N7478_008363 [Penicillium angulare]KAJ5273238.1 hypothetical protein N7478_008363 [Penicillium angulare]